MDVQTLVSTLDDHEFASLAEKQQVLVNIKALDGRVIEGIITEVFSHSDEIIIIQASEEPS